MASVKEHYDQVLADVYSWMFGGMESGIKKNAEFFKTHDIRPAGSGIAVDLGAGCGFQSIPLAEAGFSVTAIDTNRKLLAELRRSSRSGAVTIVEDDLLNFDRHVREPELVVCMTDTILHLESRADILSLLDKAAKSLQAGGRFVVTFRDLTSELEGLDRFIPVRNDETLILTCFLEYEPETVKVHDIVYKMRNGTWDFYKSFYRKLRISKAWAVEELSRAGFNHVASTVDNGFVTVIATK